MEAIDTAGNLQDPRGPSRALASELRRAQALVFALHSFFSGELAEELRCLDRGQKPSTWLTENMGKALSFSEQLCNALTDASALRQLLKTENRQKEA